MLPLPGSCPLYSCDPVTIKWWPEKLNLLNFNLVAQSICNHYSCFENMGRFVTKIWTRKKQGAKNRVIVIQK